MLIYLHLLIDLLFYEYMSFYVPHLLLLFIYFCIYPFLHVFVSVSLYANFVGGAKTNLKCD